MKRDMLGAISVVTLAAFMFAISIPSRAQAETPEIPHPLLVQNYPYPPQQAVPPPPDGYPPSPQPDSSPQPVPPPFFVPPQGDSFPLPNYGAPGAYPPQAQVSLRPRWGWFSAGLSTFGCLYFVSGLIGTLGSLFNSNAILMWVPLGGPLFAINTTSSTAGPSNALLVVDTVLQTAGISMMVVSLVWKRRTYRVTPVAGPSLTGLSFSTVF